MLVANMMLNPTSLTLGIILKCVKYPFPPFCELAMYVVKVYHQGRLNSCVHCQCCV